MADKDAVLTFEERVVIACCLESFQERQPGRHVDLADQRFVAEALLLVERRLQKRGWRIRLDLFVGPDRTTLRGQYAVRGFGICYEGEKHFVDMKLSPSVIQIRNKMINSIQVSGARALISAIEAEIAAVVEASQFQSISP